MYHHSGGTYRDSCALWKTDCSWKYRFTNQKVNGYFCNAKMMFFFCDLNIFIKHSKTLLKTALGKYWRLKDNNLDAVSHGGRSSQKYLQVILKQTLIHQSLQSTLRMHIEILTESPSLKSSNLIQNPTLITEVYGPLRKSIFMS